MSDPTREEALAHFGVRGMKWGVRKGPSRSSQLVGFGPDQMIRKTAGGDEFTLTKVPPNVMNKTWAKFSKNYVDSYNQGAWLTIKDKTGKKIGDANFWKKNDDELYLNWLGVDKSARGKGYASEILKAAETMGKQHGFKKMTLEVPGRSPDARHIYEKLGFKVIKEEIDPNDPMWGGLTEMEYTFGKRR